MIRSNKIRNSSHGESCTLMIPGICNGNRETVVFAHRPGGGMGLKGNDLFGAYACSACHDEIDGRTNKLIWGELGKWRSVGKSEYWLRAQDRTQLRLIEKGILVIK